MTKIEKTSALEIAKANLETARTAYDTARKAYNDLAGEVKENKGPGVIESIFEFVSKAGEKGVSKKALLDKLVARFPERAVDGMGKTINVQLPTRMSKERKVKIVKLDNGNFKLQDKPVKKTKAPKKEEAAAE